MQIADEIAKYTVNLVRRAIGYVMSYDSNIDKLETEVQKLKEVKAGVQHSIDAAQRNGEEIEDYVNSWLKKVNDIVEKSERLHDNVGCLNICSKHNLSRDAEEMTLTFPTIWDEFSRIRQISYRLITPLALPPSSGDYKALGSRISILDEIKHALKEANIYKIGVYGMPGVGKTTLTDELEWQVQQDRSFDVVVVATVTKFPDVKKIQGEIAYGLGLKFDEEIEKERAHRLRERIKKEKKILVILDDIWKKLNLTKVGIPFGDDHKGCKLLLTSRNLDVLKSEMGTQKEFRLEVLSKEESWSLFEKKAGDVVNDINLRPTALKVAKSCGDLPLLIVIVANALKDKQELYVWKDALQQLTRFDPEGLRSTVYSAIELSYTCLKTDELKSFFLFIGSFGNGIASQDLLTYGWGLGLYKNVDTLTDARNRVYRLIDDLRASCLLLEGKKDLVRMHELVYDQASSIASTKKPFYVVQRHCELKEWPDMDSLKNHRSIFLPWCYIKELPERLDCPELEIIVLNSLDNYLKVPNNFLDGVRELKVLDFRGLDFCPSPPLSLCHLTNLRALYLCRCMLEDITIVAKLTHLEILDLDNCEIKELPVEIGQLTHLRLLNLTSCSELRAIPANLISNLKCLEELYMGNCFIQWKAEGSKHQSNKACLGELRNLHKLKVLNLHIEDVSVLPRDLLIFEKLESYKILIGDGWKWPWTNYGENYEISRTLKLNVGTITNIHLDCGIKRLMNSAEELYLSNFKGVKNVLYLLNGEGSPQLKHLHIQNNDKMQCIFDSTEWIHSRQAFPNLESMVLHNLINMEKICHGPLPVQSFTKLKVIKVVSCERLRSILFYAMVRILSQLTEIEISQCKSVTEIIVEDDKEIDKIEVPKLRSLTLDCLPPLVSFYPKPSQSEYCIPMALFDEKIVLSNMERLKLSSMNLKNIWDDQLSAPSCIQSLTSLTIDNCDSLKQLFSSTVARGLVKLQYLKITKCKILEEIFVSERKMDHISSAAKSVLSEELYLIGDGWKWSWATYGENSKISRTLKLNVSMTTNIYLDRGIKRLINSVEELYLANSKGVKNVVYQLNREGSPQLKHLHIQNNDEMQYIFDSIEWVHSHQAFPNLESLVLHNVINMEKICHGPLPVQSFTKLKVIKVVGCERLKNILFYAMVQNLSQLTEVEISQCKCVTEIIVKDDKEIDKVELPKLRSLTLDCLPLLVSFYAKPLIHNIQSEYCIPERKTDSFIPMALFDEKIVLSNMERLKLSSMNLKNIWDDQLSAPSCIQSLTSLTIDNCDNLKYLFSSTVARGLVKLQYLKITRCKMLEEIFVSEGKMDHNSRAAKSVLSEELQVFKSKTQEHVPIDQQPLLSIEKVIWNIEEPVLSSKDVMMICNGQLDVDDYIYTVKALGLRCFHDESEKFPSNFLKRFTNLEKLKIDCSSFIEILSSESLDSEYIYTNMRLTCLELWKLRKLEHLCNDKSKMQELLQNLEILEVYDCDGLKNIAPSLVLFQNLDTLHVVRCDGLVNLISLSTATSLLKLKKWIIEDCEMIEEIVTSQEEDASNQIITFVKLEHLQLRRLSRLTSFCKGNYGFQFPLLKLLFVIECPMMETFSQGMLSTPSLRSVGVTDEVEWRWDGDLNTTITKMFREKNSKRHLGSSSKSKD